MIWNAATILEKASSDSGDIDPARPIDLEAENYCDPDAGVSIEVLQKRTRRRRWRLLSSVREEMAPVISVSPGYAQVTQGESLVSEIAVVNNMALGCGTRTFSLKADLPDAEWAAVFSPSPDLEIASNPSATSTVSVLVGIPENASPGFYTLTFRAGDNEPNGRRSQRWR